MSTTAVTIARQELALSSTTIYTSPASTTTVLTNIIISNSNSSAKAVTFSIDGVPILSQSIVNANDTVAVDLKQVVDVGLTITAFSNSAGVYLHASGIAIV